MICFISDVHLGYFSGKENRELEDLLLTLLETISSKCKVLVIVGDLFDFWFDYKQVIPKHFFRVVNKLFELREKGVVIEYLMGNHDFGHYSFFKDYLGIEVSECDIAREYLGKKFYISHGDGKIKNDTGYQILKFILRNKVSRFLFRWVHPDIGIWIASHSSKKSRNYSEKRANKNFDSLFDFAKKQIDLGFDYVVFGHSHKSEIKSYKNGFYINLGTWLNFPQVGLFDGKDFKLLSVEQFIKDKFGD